MRYGFTTGSCAAAAAKAAAYMLLTGKEKHQITIETPKGIPYHARIEEIKRRENSVSCAVQKDGGDDPDITTGALIVAKAIVLEQGESGRLQICISGGEGVGKVTRPGLDQPVGEAAINHVPREMITKEVTEVCNMVDFSGMLQIEISVPKGVELAKKTFNPRLGIEGGISILGTSGIVEPMSSQALLDTIRVELSQKYAEGNLFVPVSPGNYGLEFMQKTYHFDLDLSVKCSNFIGETIAMAAELGFRGILLTGHIGKLVKVSGGIMNTHSKEGDCRMELLAAAVLRALSGGQKLPLAEKVLECYTTEEALAYLKKAEVLEPVMQEVMDKIMFYLKKRAAGRLDIECLMYANEYGTLAISGGAARMLEEIKKTDMRKAAQVPCSPAGKPVVEG